LISLFHEMGQIERIEHERKGVLIKGRIPGRLEARYKPYAVWDGYGENHNEPPGEPEDWQAEGSQPGDAEAFPEDEDLDAYDDLDDWDDEDQEDH
jgi:hypothetical protein